MIEINVNKQFNVHYIPIKNTDVWNRLDKYLSTIDKNTKVILDFKDIQLEEPCKNMDFHNIILRENVHFRLYNYSSYLEDIDMTCRLCGVATNRVENVGNIGIEPEKPDRNVELKPRIVTAILKHCHVEGENLKVDVYGGLFSVSRQSESNSLNAAIEQFIDSYGGSIKTITIDLKDVIIQKNVMPHMVQIIEDFRKKYEVSIDNLIGQSEFDMNLAIKNGLTSAKDINLEERLKTFKGLDVGTVGLLIMYDNKRGGTDSYGRVGNGKTLWCRFSIFDGLVRTTEGIGLKFKVFNNDHFHTSVHKVIEHIDSNMLHYDTVIIALSKVGFYNSFLGSEYHFNLPIQFEKSESIREWIEVEDSQASRQLVTIPELAKYALDEYDVEYNVPALEEAIRVTREILASNEENESEF